MKKLSVVIIVMSISLMGFSQVHFQIAKSEPLAALLKYDTLEILDIRQIKFIKIGENVYEIKSPTIEKVEKQPSFPQGRFFSTDTTLKMQYFLPNASGIINTNKQ